MDHVVPKYEGSAFNCPFCEAYANMVWGNNFWQSPGWAKTGVSSAYCTHCNRLSFWLEANKTMIFPAKVTAPSPHPDMPEAIRSDYNEARDIASRSPRAAAALLRLTIQKLCKELGQPGKNLNDDIGALVRRGLPIEVQQALDIVRVVGNNAVHPGELSDTDVSGVTNALFGLTNQIVDDLVAKPKRLKALFDGLPEGARKAIDKRDVK